jgi:hypothetical protein
MGKLSKEDERANKQLNLKVFNLLLEYEKQNNKVNLTKFTDYLNNLGLRTIYNKKYAPKTIYKLLEKFQYKLKNGYINTRLYHFKSQGVINAENLINCFYKKFNCISLSFLTSPILLDYFDKKLQQENLKEKIIKANNIIKELKLSKKRSEKLLFCFYGLDKISSYKDSLQSCIGNSSQMISNALKRLNLTKEIKINKVYEINGQLIELDPIYCKPKDKNKVEKIIDNIMQEIKEIYENNIKQEDPKKEISINECITPDNYYNEMMNQVNKSLLELNITEEIEKTNKETSIYDLLEEIQAKEKTSIDIIKTVLMDQDKRIKELENKLKGLL